MRNKKIIVILIILILAVAAVLLLKEADIFNRHNSSSTNTQTSDTQSSTTTNTTPDVAIAPAADSTPTQSISAFAEPVANFKAHVTKKPFGIYITPQNSPIQPERFSGYHTGADAEYQDMTDDVPVYAIADCTIVLSRTASGYGGVFMISFDLNGVTHTALYGHIRPSGLPKVGTSFKHGEQLGFLGAGYSSETDGERRHLHFAILSDSRLDIKGYVQSKAELSGWIDPLTLF